MKEFSTILLLFFATNLFGQSDTLAPKFDRQMSFIEFVSSQLKYPTIAAENGIQGRVDFSLQITEKGCIDSIKIINSPHDLLSREVIRILKKTKCKWIPGNVDGVPKRVTMSSFIDFNLEYGN